jgi:aminoglycoside 6'-N-acetyltransferase I
MRVRAAIAADQEALVRLRSTLWPEAPAAVHRDEVLALLRGEAKSTLPLAVFVAEAAAEVVGFVEVGLRSHADGCDPSRPCGFVEGWYVEPSFQRRGVGRALLAAAERWCAEQGCVEIASDTWADNEASQRAHEALGFEVVDRCVNYRKALRV